MGAEKVERAFFPIPLGGVLNEAATPSKVGRGLTACNNLVYRRFGAWGKRAGSTPIYMATAPAQPPPTPVPPPPPYTPPTNPINPPDPPPSPPGTHPPRGVMNAI